MEQLSAGDFAARKAAEEELSTQTREVKTRGRKHTARNRGS